jgi:TPR repeat protein
MPSEDDPLGPLWAKAKTAASSGNYRGLLIVWKELAEKGVWQLTARIGAVYESGASGVERDQTQALYWYRKAVFESDDPIAHVGLGRA